VQHSVDRLRRAVEAFTLGQQLADNLFVPLAFQLESRELWILFLAPASRKEATGAVATPCCLDLTGVPGHCTKESGFGVSDDMRENVQGLRERAFLELT
jgi:hypothetical protein